MKHPNKRHMSVALSLLSLTILACNGQKPIEDYSHYLRNKGIVSPTTDKFPHCYNYGCQTIVMASLSAQQWSRIEALFKKPSKNASDEREKIAKAIGLFEEFVGHATGTKADKRGTFNLYVEESKTPLLFQQDCVDESTNTTVYLALLLKKGWIKFHTVTQPQSRQPLFSGSFWWHQSATIRDNQTKQQFAVDSWFEENGTKAHIIPIKQWFEGWKPESFK